MKKVIFILFALSFGLNLKSQTQKLVSSKIVFVDVFRNQAQVKRSASVTLEAGNYALIFDKISNKMLTNTAEIIAPEGVEVLSISSKRQYKSDEELPKEIADLQDSLQQVKDLLQGLRLEREGIQVQKDLLMANKNIGGTNQGVKADELEDILGVFQRKFAEFKTEFFRIEKQEKYLKQISQNLQKQINEYTSGKQGLSNQIWVQVKVNRDLVNANFTLQYLVNSVSWQPMYDIRVKDVQSPIQFVLKAGITQNTGEIWDQVKMRLSSNDPQTGNIKPELNTQFINFREPVLYKQNRKAKSAYRSADMEAMPMVAAEADMDGVGAIQEQQMLNLSFEIQGLVYVATDNKLQQVELNQFKLPAVYGFAAVPKLSDDVFVTAKVQNNDLISQLSGNASIYLNGVFTGKIYLYAQSTDSLLLTLGKDRRLQAKRELVKNLNSKTFFGSNKKELQTYELVITNTSKETIQLMVEDQIPVSTQSELEVKLISSDKAEHNPETGKLTWNISLEPKQIKKLRFSFELIYPKEKFININ
ncbi:MAG: DUF4139 domain-containing protein [Bacteroidia bacterium]|nr:DUF4139 domain-containing protein [Bacteroidia bacterium]